MANLSAEVNASYQATISELIEAIDRAGNYIRAAELLRGLLFIDKFATELDDVTADLA